ncbi:MAG: type II toxin-antitoxin system RelE/ParE family toxin [Flavobacteriaceae bacterium]|jgi:plasmid stabilization system protein ParE|nr:type II toxin-antitoxin system RelE/ParE family toxin [Flavobacteriaceae bacterium]
MVVNWTKEAEINFDDTLEYWRNRNQSDTYSEKIILETRKTQNSIADNPHLARFHDNANTYQRIFFKGKFSLFYKIKGETILITRFRDNRQKPLY